MKSFFKVFSFFLVLGLMIGCGGSGSSGSDDKIQVRSVDVLGTKNIDMKKEGGTLDLSLATYDDNKEFIQQKVDVDDIKITKATITKLSRTRAINEIVVETKVESSLFTNKSNKVKNIVIDLDSTGSMYLNDPYGKRKDAAKKLLDITRNSDDKIAVAEFDYSTTILADFTNDNAILKSAIDLVSNSGSTYMNDSLLEVEDLLIGKNGTKDIVILTDGITADPYKHDDVIKKAKQNDITIYTIALGDDFDDDAIYDLKDLANKTNGIFAKIKDPEGLNKIYKNFGVAAIKGSSTVKFKIIPPKELSPGRYKLNLEGTIAGAPFKEENINFTIN